MASGDGPRDWRPDDHYVYPRSPTTKRLGQTPGGRLLWAAGVGLVGGILVIGGLYLMSLLNPTTPVASPVQHPGPIPSVTVVPVREVYPTAASERVALMHSAQRIATSLDYLAGTGQSMPTSYSATAQGYLVGEPIGVVLGGLAYGDTIEWAADSTGRVISLTLIGSTFKTRVPLDVGAIPLAPAPNT